MFKKAAQVAIVVISYIIAFMVYQRIEPEKLIKPDDTHLAGEDTPRLSGREEFEALNGTDSVTAEPEEVIPTGVYALKPWVDPYKVRTTGSRRAPDATDSSVMSVEYYQEFYLIRLPDQTYILAQLSGNYRDEIEKGRVVTPPIGVKKTVSSEAQKYLKEICEKYGADSSRVLYMIDDEWQEQHDSLFFAIKLGIAVVVFFVVGVLLLAGLSKITGGEGQ